MKHYFSIIYIIAIAMIAVCGVISTSCADQSAERKKIYLERADKAVNLYNQLCKAITVINENNDAYIQLMTANIENGTFSESDDATAFNKMFLDIDAELKHFNISQLCDSLFYGNLTCSKEFTKWPQDFKRKVENLESLIGELCTIGHRVGGFNERRIVWENEPWASANSPYYRNLKAVPEHAEALDNIGEKINKIISGTYSPCYRDNSEAEKMESEAISSIDSNRNKAVELFTSAANQGQAHSMYCLGLIAEDKGDNKTAKKWYEKAAISGSSNAMVELAKRYYNPLNIGHQYKSKADRQLAKKWYQRAANFGNPKGIYNMALYYYMGWLDEKDNKTAENYCSLGIVYQDAKCANLKGVLQTDKNEQAKYYRLALSFDPDNTIAKENLRRLGYNY